MKRLVAVAILALAAACSSASNSATPNAGQHAPGVDIHISGSNLQRETLMVSGNLAATFEFTVTNGTSEPVLLRTIDLQSYGSNSFTLNSGRLTVRRTIAPAETVTLKLNTTGFSAGGYIATQEPINLRGEAIFDQGKKPFVRQFMELIDPR